MLTVEHFGRVPEKTRERRRVWLLETPAGERLIHFNVRAAYWLCKVLAVPMRRSRRIQIETTDVVHGSRYIIASNHQSIADTFIVCSQFPFGVWQHMGTLRYFAANGLMVPGLRTLIMALGCFPARTTPKWPSGLEYGLKQLKMGRTVFIFPEGRRTIRGQARTRSGVEVLAHSHQAMVVPAHIEWQKTRLGRRFRIGIGKPFDGTHLTAQEILDRIYDVPVR